MWPNCCIFPSFYQGVLAQICDHFYGWASEAGHTRRFPKFIPFCPFRCRRAKRSRPMQIPPPPDHRSRCGLEGRLTHPDPTSRSPRRSRQANDARIREPPKYNDPSAQIRDHSMAGSQKQAIPEGFRNLSCFARSGFRGQNEADRCRSQPPPPTIVLAAGWKADFPTPILRPDHRADPGRQTTPRSGDN